MNYRNLLVHLNDSEPGRQRLDIALRIAQRFGAHVVGFDLAPVTDTPRMISAVPGAAEMYAEVARQSEQRRGALRELFDASCRHAAVAGRFLPDDASDTAGIVRHARVADLVIAGQPDPNVPGAHGQQHIGEHLLMSAGRPVLFVPHTGVFPSVGSRIMIAWNAGREAARALYDAMPFIARAQQNTVVTVHGAEDAPLGGRLPGADIAVTLARHDAVVDVLELEAATGQRAASLLLSCANTRGFDLVVMGGYAHTRWHEAVWGGVTRAFLQSMPVPVLMSN